MKRRNFIKTTAAGTGMLLAPSFLNAAMKPVVYFGSFQDLLGRDKGGGVRSGY